MEEEFEILAVKVLSGEASAEEKLRFEELIAQSTERRQDYAGLKAAWASLKATAPITQALDAPPAPIPEQRLRQLQQVVREKVQATKTVASSQTRRLASSADHEPMSALGAFRRWLKRRTGVSPVPLCVSGLMVLCASSLVFWFLQPRKGAAPEISSNETFAYLIVQEGVAEVIRAGKALPAVAAVSLRHADELRLAPAAQAMLLTRTGAVAVAGPLRSPISSLVPGVRQTASGGGWEKLQAAMFRPVPELLAAGLLVTTRGGQSIPLYSPAGATADLTPLILWKSEPGKTYDITITDEFDAKTPPWRLTGATSPVEFANVETWKGRALAKDGLYRLRISEARRPLTGCEYTFRTENVAANSPSPSAENSLAEAVHILTAAPDRVGDAMSLLLRLPPEQADAELALRLKLFLFAQLGYHEDFETALARLHGMQ